MRRQSVCSQNIIKTLRLLVNNRRLLDSATSIPQLRQIFPRSKHGKHRGLPSCPLHASYHTVIREASQDTKSGTRSKPRYIHALQTALGLFEDSVALPDKLLVSLDIEHDGKTIPKIFQIGLATLDRQNLRCKIGASDLRGSVHVHLFQIRGSKVKVSHPTIEPKMIREEDIASEIANILCASGGKDINLIGHNIGTDLKILRDNAVDIKKNARIRSIVDTYPILKALNNWPHCHLSKAAFSLRRGLASLGIRPPKREFHNGASDALYALQLALLLGVKSAEIWPVFTDLEQLSRLDSLETVARAIADCGQPGADGKVTFHVAKLFRMLPQALRPAHPIMGGWRDEMRKNKKMVKYVYSWRK